MPDTSSHDLAIIGGGPAGLTASIYATRALLDAVTIEQASFGGQAAITDQIDNYPGVKSVNGAELGMRMQEQAEDLGAEFVYDAAESLSYDAGTRLFTVACPSEVIEAKSVILATGGTPRLGGFDGEERFRGHGVSYCATCDGMFYTGKEVFVVGGGNTACEEAVFLTRFATHVTLVVRKDHLRANPAVIESVMQNEKVEVRFLTSIVSIDGKELPSSITFRENETGKVYTWSSEEGSFGVFVFVGHEPATSLVDGLVDLVEDGTVKTDVTMATRTPGLFCAGDVRHTPLRQVITAASDGAIAATSAAQFLGQRTV